MFCYPHGMATAEQRFEADKKFAYRALQDARQYVTDFDRTGSKAEALYKRLARADSLMRPWSTDGSSAQAQKAIEYLQEITSILSEKIGPASRREFSEQRDTRHHAMKKSSTAHQGRWDDGPGAWQRGYDFAKEAMFHEMRAEQREILKRVAKSASSSYDYGFLAAYQDAFGVPRSRAHATKKKSLARYWKVVRVDLITKEETLVAANFSTKADAEEAALDYLAGSKSTKYLFKPKAQGSRPIKGPHDTY